MAGRKPTPTKLKMLRGNPGKRALNKKEPESRACLPKKPSWVKGIARKVWVELGGQLKDMGVMTLPDKMAFEALCLVYKEYREALEVVDRDGYTYEVKHYDKDGNEISSQWKKRPEAEILSDAWKRMRSMMVEFGITPSSRSKIEAVNVGEIDPMEEYLSRAR